ncbi:MAG: hypothetical protein AAFY38_16975 [Pseudomonadota bacterium]
MADKITLLNHFFQDVYKRRQLDRVPAYFTKRATINGLLPDLVFSPADLRELIASQIDRMAQIEGEITQELAQDNCLTARVSLHCIEAETSTPATLNGLVTARFSADTKISEAYFALDFLSFFEQLGQLPRNALPLLLTGAAIK